MPQGSLGIAESVLQSWPAKGSPSLPGYAVLAPPQSSCFQILTQPAEFREEAQVFSAHTHTYMHSCTHVGHRERCGLGNRILEVCSPICPGKPAPPPKSSFPVLGLETPFATQVTSSHLLLTDHLLTADPGDAHNLHSLTSIVDSITVEDVSVAFPDETMPN